mmetsp:Transcript_13469/g.20073  ORF Transcript_13469/g.20073 Transcript_13469/m.20073 type:complete len:224 (-) Transcript_13469:14-685(-)
MKQKRIKGGEDVSLDILDLCSSWVSHLPPTVAMPNKNNDPNNYTNNEKNNDDVIPINRVIGVGMNAEEMETNPQLTSYYIQNLNLQPNMSQFENESFDIIFCSLSVDYLIEPKVVFEELQRVLRKDGVCIMTFSNRYFRKKVIQMWLDCDDAGRMDIVASYFYYSGNDDSWKSIEALDIKLPKTMDTIYEFVRRQDLFKWFATAIFRGTWRTDPIFAVKAVKK